MRWFLCVFLVLISFQFSSQTVSGVVIDEESSPLPATLVMNMTTNQKVYTNLNGEFSIAASEGNELRFIRQNYERNAKVVGQNDYSVSLKIALIRMAQEIEEIEVNQKLSGELAKDNKQLGPPKNEIILNNKIREYHRQKSDISVMKAKNGEFVQPKGPGFETTKIGYQWGTFDFFLYLESNLGKEYFYSMGLNNLQIQPFIFFALTDFEKSDILRFGYCSALDLARFQVHAEKKILLFKHRK